jgi:HD-GYP domain-containing protein (c-di-GMP phosphodiesterase class II)
MPTPTAPKHGGLRFSLDEQSRALGIILAEEFGVPFVVHDAETGAVLYCPEGADPAFAVRELACAEAQRMAAEAPVRVDAAVDGHYPVTLLCYEGPRPVLLAAGRLPALARTPADAALEQTRLQKWLHSLSARLRHADRWLSRHRQDNGLESSSKTAWEVILTVDNLLRHLRIYRDPGQNRQRILQAAHGLVGVQSLVWVPRHADEPVLMQGSPCLSAWDCRQLAVLLSQNPELQASRMLMGNEFATGPLGNRFPPVHNVLVLPVNDNGPLGWILALNKLKTPAAPTGDGKPDTAAGAAGITPFRRSDAALLTPFAGLMECHHRSADRYRELKELLVGLTRALTAAIDAKDSYTYGHSERVARIAVELGRELGLHEEELSDIYLAGLLHDIGKIGIPDAILSKRGALTDEEFEQIKQHVIIGHKILADLKPIRNLLPGVLHHHEHYDGKGYPEGLAGEAIPLLARVLAVADAYDAMSTARPYRTAMPHARVEEVLTHGAGRQWDERVIAAFQRCQQRIRAIRQRGVGESLRQALDDALAKADGSASGVAAGGGVRVS